MQYFGSNIVEGVAESWVEAEMSWVEVDGAGWRLKLTGWRWVEVDGAGWRWVSNTLLRMKPRIKTFSNVSKGRWYEICWLLWKCKDEMINIPVNHNGRTSSSSLLTIQTNIILQQNITYDGFIYS